MEFCNFLYSLGGDYYNEDMTRAGDQQRERASRRRELYAHCVNNAAQPGAASANLNDTMATYSQGKAFSMVSYMFMLSVLQRRRGVDRQGREHNDGHAGRTPD